MTRRRSVTPARKRRIAEYNNWLTPQNEPLAIESGAIVTLRDGKPVEYDHALPLALDGADDDGPNMQPITPAAHKAKTKGDAAARAKVNRIRGVTKAKRRGFPKSTKYRRKMDGTVEELK